MGLVGVQENGNGEMGLSGISLGTKNKYKRMDSELSEDHDDLSRHQEDRASSTRKYVLACAVFASLNNVLLGYGMLFFLRFFQFVFFFSHKPDYVWFVYMYMCVCMCTYSLCNLLNTVY